MKLAQGYEQLENGTIRCCDCSQVLYNGTLRHGSRCDLAPRKTVALSSIQLTESGITTAQAEVVAAKQATIQSAAKAGNLRAAGYSDEEIVDAVRCGAISVSDAMNQDC